MILIVFMTGVDPGLFLFGVDHLHYQSTFLFLYGIDHFHDQSLHFLFLFGIDDFHYQILHLYSFLALMIFITRVCICIPFWL